MSSAVPYKLQTLPTYIDESAGTNEFPIERLGLRRERRCGGGNGTLELAESATILRATEEAADDGQRCPLLDRSREKGPDSQQYKYYSAADVTTRLQRETLTQHPSSNGGYRRSR